jgi:hypothetical protein
MEKEENYVPESMVNFEGIRPLRRYVSGCCDFIVDIKEIGLRMWIGLMWINLGISGCTF